ncbi:MAG: DNA polymerase IV [Trichlorobacter sp.]|uniref:DNA polymerase IV n=1 Tax=Trichlorobacter sp. TaxID=2911007 RepID=UPI0025627B17|nr:DNA polymerase IV [Trichlorobacter sp.]MDK9716870.1 DNA polymerase IV [Trichlorobacter sp.]
MSDRVVMHIDMNAFFASVEQQANPELQGKPIAVVGASHRTVITTSSYEARKFGVKTGMAIWEGKRVCPDLIIVRGDNKKYTYTSSRIVEMMKQYTPLVEVFSIDEAWLDVTHSLQLFGSAERIAYLLKAQIKQSFGITCSIGIAPNKLLAKLASDMQKPDGLTVIPPDRVAQIIERLPVGDLCGVGKKLQKQLALYFNIHTCGELGRADEKHLAKKFGIIGRQLKQMGQGIDTSPVIPQEDEEQVKSVGHSMTPPKDIENRDAILRRLLQLSEMVGRRARRYGLAGKTVSIYVRLGDFFSNFQKQTTLPTPVNLSDDIYQAAIKLFDSMGIDQPIRLLGISISNLHEQQNQQPSLFESDRRKEQLAMAMDAVNNKLGDFSVTYGSLLDSEEKGSHVISPAWRPEGIRNVGVK